MNLIKKISQHDLYYNLHQLNEYAKAVAFAKSPEDMEFFTTKYLRPQIEATDNILKDIRNSINR